MAIPVTNIPVLTGEVGKTYYWVLKRPSIR